MASLFNLICLPRLILLACKGDLAATTWLEGYGDVECQGALRWQEDPVQGDNFAC